MAFTETGRIWWDTTSPGQSTASYLDAVPDAGLPASEDRDTGTANHLAPQGWQVCARSGFSVPKHEIVIDPVSGSEVWDRFVDKPDPRERGLFRGNSFSSPIRTNEA